MDDLVLAISLFEAPATTRTTPTLRRLTWPELFELLSHHERRFTKEGRGWSPASYAHGTTRKNQNVRAVSCFVGDVDHVSEGIYEAIHARLQTLGLAHVIYSTFSNSPPDDLRFRVVVPFVIPVPANGSEAEGLRLWLYLWHAVTEHVLAGRNDPQTKDLSRFFYLPAAPGDGLVFVQPGEGKPLDWESLVGSVPQPAASYSPPPFHRPGSRTREFVTVGAPAGDQRGRALAAGRALLASGVPVAEATDLVWQGLDASPVGDPSDPWEFEDARGLVEDLAAREPTPLLSLSQGGPPPERRNGLGGESDGNDEFQPTDYGNAERLAGRHGDDLRYCYAWDTWLGWDGKRFGQDADGEIYRRAKETVRSMYSEAAGITEDAVRRGLLSHAKRSEAHPRIRAMIGLAQSEPGIAVRPEELDADPWALNVLNGTLDLRTGALHPHQRSDLLTKLGSVAYHADATCPTWDAFLERIMPKPGLLAFLQRAIGYSLTGDTSERVIFIAYGTGANGKSTLFDTCRSLFGDYAASTPAETFLIRREGSIPNDLARLKGARFVTAVEADAGRRLAESLVKQAAGGVDVLSARFMRAEWFEFRPEFKVWLATNPKPVIRGIDHAIWDRIRLIPFSVRIPDDEQDRKLVQKLRTELPGILAWAVRGCLAWQQAGLDTPSEVRDATAAYRAEMDTLTNFIDERCLREEGQRIAPTSLYEAFCAWCETNGERAFPQRELATRLQEMGFVQGRTGGSRWWTGLGLRDGAQQ